MRASTPLDAVTCIPGEVAFTRWIGRGTFVQPVKRACAVGGTEVTSVGVKATHQHADPLVRPSFANDRNFSQCDRLGRCDQCAFPQDRQGRAIE